MESHSDEWLRRFAARGWPAARLLAAGMEGTVYELDGELIGKVWSRRKRSELIEVGTFYEQLASAGFELATPRFLEIWEDAGVTVTVEPRLPGVRLDQVRPLDRLLDPGAVECMLDVLAGLRASGVVSGARALSVLEESQAMWSGVHSWPAALAGLLERRLALSADLLCARVPGFERRADRLVGLVVEMEVEETTVLHGDLIPANVLVDGSLRPVAVIDFGFLTTVGDPLFDLAVTASIYDMYGPGAVESEAAIDAAAARRWQMPTERLAIYRAAYAVATATIYDAGGKDGHFRWCAETLRRPEIELLLGSAS